jgi:AcrR family transcriptional regulator
MSPKNMPDKENPQVIAPDPKLHNRARTEAAILSAARDLLAADGFQGLGVNAVARRAGCDKQLIYRYFGGIEGLVDAIGLGLANWITDSLAGNPDQPPPASYAELMERLVIGFLAAFRANPLVQKIAAWELSERSEHVSRLAAARSAALSRWIVTVRGQMIPPPATDAAAINAILIAGLQHIVLSAATSGGFAGIQLRTDNDWKRIETASVAIVRAMYSPA